MNATETHDILLELQKPRPNLLPRITSRLPKTTIDHLHHHFSPLENFYVLTQCYARQICCELATQFSEPYRYSGDDTIFDYAPSAAEALHILAVAISDDNEYLPYHTLVFMFTGAMPTDVTDYNELKRLYATFYDLPIWYTAVDVPLSILSVDTHEHDWYETYETTYVSELISILHSPAR